MPPLTASGPPRRADFQRKIEGGTKFFFATESTGDAEKIFFNDSRFLRAGEHDQSVFLTVVV